MARLTRRQRAALTALHRWLGLGLGLLFTLLGATGSLLVFYVEADRALNPPQRLQATIGQPSSLDDILALLRAAHPQRHGGWRLELPLTPGQPLQARYYQPEETAERDFAPLMVTVDPYRPAILQERFWGHYAVTWIYDLHFNLLLDRNGRLILGLAALALLALILIGLLLWWPARGRRLAALRPRLGPSGPRRIYDLHVLAGIYGLPLLLLLTVTGAVLEQPGWFKPLLARFSPVDAGPRPVAEHGAVLIGPQQALRIAQATLPDAEIRWLETPAAGGGFYRLRLYQPGDPSRRFPHSLIWIDAERGEVLAVREARRDSGADTFFNWLHPLHNGEAFGLTGRLLVALAGLLPGLLLLTGLWRWRQKARARRGESSPRPASGTPRAIPADTSARPRRGNGVVVK